MAMATDMRVMVVMVVVVVLGAGSLRRTEAADHVVGGSSGWQTPSNSTFYSDWASTKSFALGDTLTFNFNTGAHSVADVTRDVYTNCNTASANNVITSGPATITLNSTGQHYYFCTFPGHCSRGQKLAITVSGASPSPGSSPSPTTTTTTSPPPPSSASGLVVTFSMMFTAIVAGFVFF